MCISRVSSSSQSFLFHVGSDPKEVDGSLFLCEGFQLGRFALAECRSNACSTVVLPVNQALCKGVSTNAIKLMALPKIADELKLGGQQGDWIQRIGGEGEQGGGDEASSESGSSWKRMDHWDECINKRTEVDSKGGVLAMNRGQEGSHLEPCMQFGAWCHRKDLRDWRR